MPSQGERDHAYHIKDIRLDNIITQPFGDGSYTQFTFKAKLKFKLKTEKNSIKFLPCGVLDSMYYNVLYRCYAGINFFFLKIFAIIDLFSYISKPPSKGFP